MIDDWVRVAVAARQVQRGRRAIYHWIEKGRLQSLRIGRVTYVSMTAVLDEDARAATGQYPDAAYRRVE